MRILISTKNWLGDVLFQIPAIELIRKLYPKAEIVCLSSSRCREILEAHPAVSRVIVFDEKKEHRFFLKRWIFMLQLRRTHWDRAYLFHRSRTRAVLVWLSGAEVRIGYAGNRRRFLTDAIPELREPTHQVNYFLNLVQKAEKLPLLSQPYHFYFSEKDKQSMQEKLASHQLQSFVCFHLGANWEPKRWPIHHFVRLADLIHERWKLPVVLTGGPQDQILSDTVTKNVAHARVISLVGQTSLGELGALFQKSTWVVSADSGPMHIASGVGARVVAIFGPTHPDLTGPRGMGTSIVLSYVPKGLTIPWYGREEDFPREGWLVHIRPEEVVEAIEKKGWPQKIKEAVL